MGGVAGTVVFTKTLKHSCRHLFWLIEPLLRLYFGGAMMKYVKTQKLNELI